jgi:glucose-6-phosphate 1-epimerase
MESARQFEIPGVAELTPGNGGLPRVRVTHPEAVGEIYLHGAHIASWKPRGTEEVFFVSPRSQWESGRAIRGGVPICFPWFGNKAGNPSAPAHGFVRSKTWRMESIAQDCDGVTVSMSTESDENTKKWWPADFHLIHRVVFGSQLSMELITTNTGEGPLRLEEALHAYFSVGQIRSVRVRGLEGIRYMDKVNDARVKSQQGEVVISEETDRVYLDAAGDLELEDPSLSRRVRIAKQNSLTTVVWNPWKDRAQEMSDLGADQWVRTICIETSNVGDFAVELAPGQRHSMKASVSVARL